MVEQWSPSDTGGKRKMSVEAIPGGKRRIDRLRAELLRRTNGAEGEHDVAGLVAGLPGILSDAGSSNFTAIPKIRMPLPNGKHRRRLERLVSDETIARLP